MVFLIYTPGFTTVSWGLPEPTVQSFSATSCKKIIQQQLGTALVVVIDLRSKSMCLRALASIGNSIRRHVGTASVLAVMDECVPPASNVDQGCKTTNDCFGELPFSSSRLPMKAVL